MEKIVHKELAHYIAVSGMFRSTTAIAMRGEVAPDTPYLQQLAIRILGLTCSASGYEREDERVHEGDDDLTWRTFYQASGLDEPRQYTRRHKRKQLGSGEGQVGTSINPSKRAKGVASKNKGKGFELLKKLRHQKILAMRRMN
ncbi:hypothetical protein SESBI_48434 [Sesbania bispinosa]|nr:hypothetical protein SESBI_48434 [Sesbania bispinosa]